MTLPLRTCPIARLGPLAGVELVPLVPGDGQEGLRELFDVTPVGTFRYFLSEPKDWTLEGFAAWADGHLFVPNQLAFVVREARTGRVLGSSSFMDVQPAHRHVEIGCTWYAAPARGTHVNPACKLLMLRHAMQRMFVDAHGHEHGCVRVTLKSDARNVHSQAAMTKLGATREGTLRAHRIRPDGYVRDTTFFSILPAEFARVEAGLLARLPAYTS
jgi:N-acetyltransferase